jgi:hypothetical protein
VADLRVKLNPAGMRELLRDPGVRDDLKRRADRIARAAGRGMESTASTGRNRALAMVWTETPEAMAAEAHNRKLTRSIDAGRG